MIPKRHRSHFARRQKRKRTQNPGPRPPDSTAARAATRNFGADWKNRGSGVQERVRREEQAAREEARRKQKEDDRRWAEEEYRRRQAEQSTRSAFDPDAAVRSNAGGAASGEGNKALAALSYLSILFALPYIFTPNDEFAKFHAKQGLKLFVFGIVADMLAAFVGLGWIVTLIRLYLIYKGMTNALNSRKEKLPWIGNILE